MDRKSESHSLSRVFWKAASKLPWSKGTLSLIFTENLLVPSLCQAHIKDNCATVSVVGGLRRHVQPREVIIDPKTG